MLITFCVKQHNLILASLSGFIEYLYLCQVDTMLKVIKQKTAVGAHAVIGLKGLCIARPTASTDGLTVVRWISRMFSMSGHRR